MEHHDSGEPQNEPVRDPRVKLKYHGVDVLFPFTPYGTQRRYMNAVVDALLKGEDALLESPTGTGKTMALLCASLAWQARVFVDSQGQKDAVVPTIFYASRTHSQLSHVVKELMLSPYEPKMTVMGSRAQLCMHPHVSKLSGSAQNSSCRKLVSNHGCKYKNRANIVASKGGLKGGGVMDIEDLMEYAHAESICPYYLTREMVGSASIVFLPYNYLIDPKLQPRLQKELQGAVLIFDEAHNVDSVCCDAMSFDLHMRDIATCVSECQKVGNMLSGGSLERVRLRDEEDADSMLKRVMLLKGRLLALEAVYGSLKCESHDGVFILEIFAQIEWTRESWEGDWRRVTQRTEEMYLEASAEESLSGQSTMRAECALSGLWRAMDIVFSLGDPNMYKVCIHDDEAPAQGGRSFFTGGNSFSAGAWRAVSYWCFRPELAIKRLKSTFNIRSLVLTSGTLSPMDSFAAQFGLDFPVRLENDHVIQPQQLWAGVLKRGPSGVLLDSSYKNRSNRDYQADLGQVVANLARTVPDGVLVFFSSYASMYAMLGEWGVTFRDNEPSLSTARCVINSINQQKHVLIEPKRSKDFNDLMSRFYTCLEDKKKRGAVMFAVCRGKLSEGMDFADRCGRAVVVTGIPYASLKDKKTELHMQFLDSKTSGRNSQSGNEWYQQQAVRATNQALGRVIRHRKDFGAILLCDHRFAQSKMHDNLSHWLRPLITTYDKFGGALRGVAEFFRGFRDDDGHRKPLQPPTKVPTTKSAQHQRVQVLMSAGPAVTPMGIRRRAHMPVTVSDADYRDILPATPALLELQPSPAQLSGASSVSLLGALSSSRSGRFGSVGDLAASGATKKQSLSEQLAARLASSESPPVKRTLPAARAVPQTVVKFPRTNERHSSVGPARVQKETDFDEIRLPADMAERKARLIQRKATAQIYHPDVNVSGGNNASALRTTFQRTAMPLPSRAHKPKPEAPVRQTTAVSIETLKQEIRELLPQKAEKSAFKAACRDLKAVRQMLLDGNASVEDADVLYNGVWNGLSRLFGTREKHQFLPKLAAMVPSELTSRYMADCAAIAASFSTRTSSSSSSSSSSASGSSSWQLSFKEKVKKALEPNEYRALQTTIKEIKALTSCAQYSRAEKEQESRLLRSLAGPEGLFSRAAARGGSASLAREFAGFLSNSAMRARYLALL